MSAQFIVTVYYREHNRLQHFNYTNLLEACAAAKAFRNKDRLVRKVEVSTILHVWD